MDELYYNMIFKRKSFHVFKGNQALTKAEVGEIEQQIVNLDALVKDIKVAFRIVPKVATNCKRGEYCILIYSEKKANYLQNVGYLGQQLDLWLASKNIGVCWYGMGEVEEPMYNGLDFVIMLVIEKAEEKSFRKDYTKTKRKSIDEIWKGQPLIEVAEAIRYAPSACNSQPWLIESEQGQLLLYRIKGKRGIMPQIKVSHYNKIDIGIMMLFLEISLQHEGYEYTRELITEGVIESEKNLVVKYLLVEKENGNDN